MRSGAVECGAVTAETAVALPSLVFVLAIGLWAVTASGAQVACVDAARLGARSAARGDPPARVRSVAARAAPARARVTVDRDATTSSVRVMAEVPPPLTGDLPGLTVSARATAATEPAVTEPRPHPGVGG